VRKKSKLPDNLYHFTSLVKYRIILESGKLALTPSNLKFDPDTFHYEPIYFRKQEIGMQAVDKYKDHHPVVWLTANDQATAQNTGLSDDTRQTDDSGDISAGVISAINTTLTALRRLHSSSQHPITQTGTSVNRRFLWPTLPRLSFWTKTGFIRKRIKFRDSRLRMWRRNCLRKKNQIKSNNLY